ncbi:MFS transporter [Candidatus Dojkabacteria bacterium]|uniref:MFS transporter n=1 Tax=Candidatus Dojkabacteria bacterium TaxID=2099670 RepID=A0A955KZ35_9BACT|nr:MFS transporter [Candidatus Dojkabacteria bacterium]
MQQRAIKLRNYFLKDINPVIRFLIISDTVMIGAAGLLGPIFALFIEEFIKDADPAAVAGIAASIYLFTKSILQIPIANLIDRIRGEKDDFWLMFSFTIIIALIPLLYLFISTPLQLYIVQFVLGLCTAFTFPTYMAIFTRHIDKSKEGTEWGVYFTLTDLVSAALAAVGGYVASSQGFPVLIVLVVIISTIGGLLLYPIKPFIKQK